MLVSRATNFGRLNIGAPSMSATALKFTERLNLAYDINRGHAPADGPERATREEILEYIDAFSVEHSPDHPTTLIEWDLIRTLGESEGRRMLLYASRRWDANPLRARDIVFRWWDDDYEPRPWVDEYLLDVIRDWRSERDVLRALEIEECEAIARCEARLAEQNHLREAAENEWLAFSGSATAEQVDAWNKKYGRTVVSFHRKLEPVTILPFPLSPTAPAAPAASALSLTFFDECRDRSPKHWIFKGVFAKGEN